MIPKLVVLVVIISFLAFFIFIICHLILKTLGEAYKIKLNYAYNAPQIHK